MKKEHLDTVSKRKFLNITSKIANILTVEEFDEIIEIYSNAVKREISETKTEYKQ